MAQSSVGIEKSIGRKRGRPAGRHSTAKWYAARGIAPMVAAEVLKNVDELRYWRRYLASEDDNISLRAMMFLVSMRDGRPAQQINVTSTNLTIDARDIERARAVVRELSHNVGYPTMSDSHSVSVSDSVGVPQCGTSDSVGHNLTDVKLLGAGEEKANTA